MPEKLSNTQIEIISLLVLFIVWFIYKKDENLMGNINIMNSPNNNQDATELSQPDPPIQPRVYDRLTGQITDASEFIQLPKEIYPTTGGAPVVNYGFVQKLDDGYNGEMGLNYNMCSKACCSPQYPPPFALESDAMVESMKDKFVPNNYACNNAWNNAGCVCMTKEQRSYLESRGGNAQTYDK
jgi:hypothetical protein